MAAKRLIDSAIRLLFQAEDLLAINLIAMSAHQVIVDLGRYHRPGKSLEDEVNRFIPKDQRKLYWRILKAPSNFVKHADRDPKKTLGEISPDFIEETLYLAILHFCHLDQQTSREMEVFRVWYLSNRPDRIQHTNVREDNPLLQKFLEQADKPREDQLLYCRGLLVYLKEMSSRKR